MSTHKKFLLRILTGRNDKNVDFNELCKLLEWLNFSQRIKGDHHIFSKENIIEIINLQPAGKLAKPYQVKQVRQIITKYGLGGSDE